MAVINAPSDSLEEVTALLREGASLTDLLQELVSLRKWKQSHKQKEDRHHELGMLTRLCTSCRPTAQRWLSNEASVADDLPPELLYAIFRFVLPPSDLLDPAPSRNPNSRWAHALSARRRLTEVCWRWRSVAQTMLYEDIALHDDTQVRALAQTLRATPELGCLVKRIVVDCPAPPRLELLEFKAETVQDLVDILDRCTSLRSLVFTDMPFVAEGPLRGTMIVLEFPHALADAIARRASTLQRFEQWPGGSAHLHFRFPISAITPCEHLVSLAINVEHPASGEHIFLPHLEELDLSRQYDLSRADLSQRFATWEMPRLRRLALPVATGFYKTFLQAHGKMLAYLEFRDHLDVLTATRQSFCKYVHLCPSLRHLVFDAKGSDFLIANEILPHPTLQYIDIWVNSPAAGMRTTFLEMREKRTLVPGTQWKNVRLLDRALHWVTRLSTVFPPDTPLAELPSVHHTPGLSITHTEWGVYGSDLDVLYPEEDGLDKEGRASHDGSNFTEGEESMWMTQDEEMEDLAGTEDYDEEDPNDSDDTYSDEEEDSSVFEDSQPDSEL
ncbi:hypothetical protein C8Q79DRAFT_981704 [Trametes meyenii]|nr:hypothetical protein C8Q79DRAFT_981704 [Trametes meyenii]